MKRKDQPHRSEVTVTQIQNKFLEVEELKCKPVDTTLQVLVTVPRKHSALQPDGINIKTDLADVK